jgi:predicted O-methyltransferase YrrM
MNSETWTALDQYICDVLIGEDQELDAALERNLAGGLPVIDVSPAQGQLLSLLVKISGAKRILEVGTLGGYSTIFLARAVPEGGSVVTLELEQRHAEVAAVNIAEAGLSERVEIHVGPAIELLDSLATQNPEPFDFTFIDADKANSPIYFEKAAAMSRPGAVIIVDNVVREGSLIDPSMVDDPSTAGNLELHEMLGAAPNIDATTIQTVGAKGYDGFTIAIVS